MWNVIVWLQQFKGSGNLLPRVLPGGRVGEDPGYEDEGVVPLPSTVNSLYSGDCKDLELVSSLASVRNSDSWFHSNSYKLVLRGI